MGRVHDAPALIPAPSAKGLGRTLALGVAIALPLALAATSFHVVPLSEGSWRGLLDPPGTLRVCASLAFGLLAASLIGSRGTPLVALLVAAAPLVPVLTGRFASLLVFQGLALVPIALAAAAVALVKAAPASEPKPASPGALFVLALAFYALLGTRLPGAAGPQGDEPHYLTMAESLRADADLDLKNQFRERSYRSFYSGTLQAHTSPASPKGTTFAVHTPGLAFLILPAYATFGYLGVRLLLSAIAALAGILVFRLVRDVTRGEWTARIAWAAFAFLPPMAFFALAVYPETPAALATAAFLLATRRAPGPRATLGAGVAAAALPWLHPKFLPLAVLGLALTLVRRGRPLPRLGAGLLFAASLAGLLAWMQATYGQATLSAAYGPGFASDVGVSRIPWGALALFLDRQFGLLASAPLWVLAAPGLVLLWRARPGDALRASLFAAASLAVGASFSMWWGGSCPPARFVVPALPALAVALAPALPRHRQATAALFGLSLGVVAVAAHAPRALHNRADGSSALFRVLTPAVETDALLPSFVTGAFPRPPALAARRATLALLDGWDATNALGPPLTLGSLSIPLDLPEAPWRLAPGELRFSRKLDLPPGSYRVFVAGQALEAEPRDRVARIDVAVDDAVIASAYVQEGRPDPSLELPLPEGARRLSVTAVGLQGLARVENVRIVPIQIVPRGSR